MELADTKKKKRDPCYSHTLQPLHGDLRVFTVSIKKKQADEPSFPERVDSGPREGTVDSRGAGHVAEVSLNV